MTQSTYFNQVKNVLKVLQGYTKGIRFLLVMFLTLTASTAWAETVTYTVFSTSEVTKSGTAPDGSSATYKSTYSTKCQLIASNNMTLTLSGYDGCKITGLTLSMKSNSSKGAGNMSMIIGNTTISSIATTNFNNSNWHGSWSTSYVDVNPSVTATTVGNGEEIVITIVATVNSLYCQSFTLTYTPSASGGGDSGDTNCLTLSATSNYPFNSTSSSNTSVYSASIDGITFENKGGYKYNSYLSFNKSLSGAYIANTTPFSGNIESIVVDYNSGGSGYFNMYEGSTSKPSSTVVSPSKTGTGSVTYTFSGNNPYFNLALKTTGTYCNINSITICYSSTPDPIGYTITYNTNGGDAIAATSGTTLPDPLPTPTRTGYTFLGWYTDSEFNTNATAGATIDADITLYAKWEQQSMYTVNWYVNGNKEHTQEDYAGSTLTDIPNLNDYECGGKVFVGWTTKTSYEHATEAPDDLITNTTGMTMPENGKDYYAVFATAIEGNEDVLLTAFEGGTKETLVAIANITGSGLGDNYAESYGAYRVKMDNTGDYILYENVNNKKITKVYFSVQMIGGENTSTMTIQTSDNGEEYVSKGSCSISSNSGGSQKNFTVEINASPKYVKLLYTKGSNIGLGKLFFYTSSITYSNYTTSCNLLQHTVTWNPNGGNWDGNTNNKVQSYEEGETITPPLDPTREHYNFEGWSPTPVTEMGTENLTYTAQWSAKLYTITYNAGLGTAPESATGITNETGTILPSATPSTACQSEGWTFAGWAEATVTETTIAPTLFTAGSNYKPTSDCTLYAVYSYTEAGGGGSSDYVLTNIEDIADDDIVVITMTYTDGTVYALSSSNESSDTPPAPTVTVSDNKLSAEPADALKWNISNSSGTLTIYPNGTTEKWLYCTNSNDGVRIGTNTNKAFTIDASSGYLKNTNTNRYVGVYRTNPDWRCYDNTTGNTANQTLGFYVKSSGGSTTTYNSNPVCVASWSITYDFAGGTGSHCSNTSVPQGDTYTICDEAPTKEGYTFQGWSDGINTYQPNNSFTPTSDITLTAQWLVNTYIVTWNNNGVTTPIEYNHGETLELPAAPASCDGVKEFVGWTEQSGYYHATTAPTDLFKTTTATVTADKTYYAVFATKGAGGTEFVLGESGTFKMYANVNGTNYYAQGGVSDSKLGSTTNVLSASDYTLTHKGDNKYTIQLGSSNIGHTASSSTNLSTGETIWTISTGTNGSWRITSPVNESRALAYRASTYNIFKAYSMKNVEAGDTEYFDIEFGSGSSGYSDYTTTCQQVESIEVQSPQTEFYLTDDFTIGSGKVIATLSGGGTTDVTALAHFSGYNMEATGTQTVTVTYMGATATYNINVKALDNAWVLTWNVSGKTNTGLGPRSVTKGNAIGTLPTPEVPDACEGKTFMGWTTSNIVPSDGIGIEYITSATKPTDNTTYYAVFATINNFSIQKPIDQITSGTNVVIVAVSSMDANGTAGKAISSRATDDTHNLQGDDVTIVDEHINTPHSTCIWTVEKVDGKYRFSQNGKYLNGVIEGKYSNLKYLETIDSWTLTEAASGMTMTYNMKSTNASTEYVEWYNGKFTIHDEVNNNGAFDMQFFVTANAYGDADITDYTTGCAEYTITYYGFTGGYSTSSTSDGTIVLPVNSYITIPDCGDVVKDPTTLGREFLDVWMTKPHGGHSFKPGDTFVLTQDTTLYAQWKLETTGDVITLPTDVEDLAGTDIYVYGGTTLNIQPGTTTINTLVLRGGIQSDGSYKMPSIWVPEGATLVRNNNKIYLDLAINAKNWYPFAVPFATTNNSSIDYLDPVLNAASTYGTHFDIKTYDGARRADVGEDRTNNWVHLNRHTVDAPVKLQPGVGYLITAMTYPDKDTATIRIPMTVPNTWFQNGEQTIVGTTVRNTIAVTAHTGAAATEHQRHAGWNFVANPYLTNFAGNNVVNDGGLNYINGAIDIEGGYTYGGEDVPYVTVPAYDFSYYEQYKLSDVKLSPEWSFFVQVGTSGTMNFTTEGRQHAPATIRANSANAKPSFDANIVIINENANEADHTGLVINDRYSTAYEIGGDLEKMFGSANRTALYTLNNNIRLAYNALAMEDATQPIPLGYRAEKAGEYTIQLTNPNEIVGVESIVIKDNYNNVTTNLLISDYTFYTEQVQDDERFVIYIVPKQNTTTNLMDMVDKTETKKVIFNNHLYIIHNGYIYDGVGKTIKNK
ncbi:MAG: InlB B-repeat-containing protein [Paludibacteraceae bacterium]|nr:InlB B-repeat-containing protein [Paludibacteraceae bacterium]